VFDVEAVDNHIWDLAVQHVCTGQLFHRYIDPQLSEYPTPPHPDLFHVTDAFLQKHGAQPFSVVVHELIEWMGTIPATHYVLISHGCFVLDKRIMETEFGRLNMVVPTQWFFFDTLPFFRLKFRKQPSYSLGELYKAYFQEPIIGAHFATTDTLALRRLLLTCFTAPVLPYQLSTQLHGCYYPAFYTPLQSVRYIGTYNEQLLVMGGLQCVEDLFMLLRQQCRMCREQLQNILTVRYHLRNSDSLKISTSVLHMLIRTTGKTNRPTIQ